MVFTAYLIFSVLLIILDCIVGFASLHRKNTDGRRLAETCWAAATVNVFYIASIQIEDYFLYSVFSSLYFIGIDILLTMLMWFAESFTRLNNRIIKNICVVVSCLCAVDTIVYIINPFKEIAISYHYDAAQQIAPYEYNMDSLYIVHLILTYAAVLFILLMFIIKAASISAAYRIRYDYCTGCIVIIVILNAVFLFLPGNTALNRLDLSTALYSIAAVGMYYCCFTFVKRTIVKSYERTVFRNLQQGILLFDYDNTLILKNDKAMFFFKDMLNGEKDPTLQEFMKSIGIEKLSSSFIIQSYTVENEKHIPINCEYKNLKDKRDRTVGYMFIISDALLEVDPLTGFHKLINFKHMINTKADYDYDRGYIAVFDINALSIINKIQGYSTGDKIIKALADAVKNSFKNDGYYIRGNEAALIVIVRNRSFDEIEAAADKIKKQFDYSIQYAISNSESSNSTVIGDIESAIHTMEIYKIMDKSSVHSSILTSLIKTLQEYDSDTERHVKRTQITGKILAENLGLSSEQVAQLELLCILHDIGKIAIPVEILKKPGKLTHEEWEIMKTHTQKGWAIANCSDEFKPIAEFIRHHHERWDGKGYPEGLSKESIPLLSRIIAVIDSFDAMINDRPYQQRISIEEAVEKLKENAGTMFDPTIVSAFVKLIDQGIIVNAMIESGLYNEKDSANDNVSNSRLEALTFYNDALSDMENPEKSAYDESDTFVFPMTHSTYYLDANDKIIKVDENFKKITGYSEKDVLGKNMCQGNLIPESDIIKYYTLVEKLLGDIGEAAVEHRIRCKDGTIKHVYCLGRQYYDSAADAIRARIIVFDSTGTQTLQHYIDKEKEHTVEQLKHWEETYRMDSMTGILTHGAFINDVESILIKGDEHNAFIIIDIDDLKKYNDTYGHNAGDELIIFVAGIFQKVVKDYGFTGRLGGDEFGAFLQFDSETTYSDVEIVFKDIFDSVNNSSKQSLHGFSISMGAVYSETKIADTFNKLYETADKALYASKHAGKKMFKAEYF